MQKWKKLTYNKRRHNYTQLKPDNNMHNNTQVKYFSSSWALQVTLGHIVML